MSACFAAPSAIENGMRSPGSTERRPHGQMEYSGA